VSRWRWVLASMLVAAVVRMGAATGLAMDADEPIYLKAATHHANAWRAGDLGSFGSQPHNPEHPALIKQLHGVGLSLLGPAPNLISKLMVVRGIEAGGGVLLAGLLATVHPVAGMVAAVHTLHAKYTAQGYLEAWPMVLMFLALMAWRRSREDPARRWIVLCGLAMGAAAAGKLIHAMPGVILVAYLAACRPRMLPTLVAAGLGSMLLLDTGLWTDPLGQMGGRWAHHAAYAGALQQAAGAPWWLPLAALSGLVSRWHPEVFPVSLDLLWMVLGLLGLGLAAWRPGPRQPLARVALAWWVVCLMVLMIWPTRWAQHALILVVPLCLGVGLLVEAGLSRASSRSGPSDSAPRASG